MMKTIISPRIGGHATTAWSNQRTRTLNLCPKKYRHSYLQKGGWRPDAPAALRQVYQLSLLQQESSFAGILTHKYIRRFLAGVMNRYPQPIEDSIRAACAEFELAAKRGATLELSQLKRDRSKFLSQELGRPLSDSKIAEWKEKIRRSLETWRSLDLVEQLLSDAPKIVPHLLDPPSPILTHCLGVPAYLKTDAVVARDDGWQVFDWKTGRPTESDERQGAIYDTFVRDEFKLGDDAKVEVIFVYLATREHRAFEYSTDSREELQWQIGEEFTDLLLVDADPSEGRFPARPNGLCYYCPYQLICEPGKRILAKRDALAAGRLA